VSGKIPVRDFYNQYINPTAFEFIDKYDPDLIWLDGDWIFDGDERNTKALVAYYYNQAKGRKEVAVNDGYGNSRLIPTLGQGPDHVVHGDFNRSEGLYKPGVDKNYVNPWEECHGLSHSFGYNWEETDEDVRSAKELLDMLIEVVAGGGNMLLITNLTNTGKLDPLLAERLKVVGAWLKINHESIYATRKWKHFAEGDIRFTRSKDSRFVYAIATKWPGQKFTSSLIKPKQGTSISLLGYEKHALPWKMENGILNVELPSQLQNEKNRPCEHAWVFKIEIDQNSK
jgi:alpha-L-fucosidase